MKLKQNLSALLAAGMLTGMLPAAGAAASPVVEYDTLGQFAELTLTGAPAGTQVHSVQLELTLDGLYSEDIDLDGSSADVSLSKVECGTDKTTLTIYIDSLTSLGQEFSVGTLEFKDPVSGINFDSTGRLTLLDERQNPIAGSLSTVTVRRMGSQDDSNTGSKPDDTTGDSSSGSTGSTSRPTSGSSGKTYEASVSKTGNGTVKVSPSDAEKGDTVTVTVTPDSGYTLQSITVYDSRGNEIDLRERSDGTYTFTMPDGKVTIEVTFAPATGSTPQLGPLPFADVPANEWYYSAVGYVYRYGMMSGTSSAAFSPEMTTNRAMIVSILHRLEGSPAADGGTFPDIAAGQYYTSAVAWAASNGIVSGYSNGLFRPDDIITREQFASILYRYAQYKGYPMIAPAALSGFPDAAEVSKYAADPMGWAVAQGLISGTNRGLLNPAGGAARAQAASILMRFCQTLANMP